MANDIPPPWQQILPDGVEPTWSELLVDAKRALKRALYHGFANFSHKQVSFGTFNHAEMQSLIDWIEDHQLRERGDTEGQDPFIAKVRFTS